MLPVILVHLTVCFYCHLVALQSDFRQFVWLFTFTANSNCPTKPSAYLHTRLHCIDFPQIFYYSSQFSSVNLVFLSLSWPFGQDISKASSNFLIPELWFASQIRWYRWAGHAKSRERFIGKKNLHIICLWFKRIYLLNVDFVEYRSILAFKWAQFQQTWNKSHKTSFYQLDW